MVVGFGKPKDALMGLHDYANTIIANVPDDIYRIIGRSIVYDDLFPIGVCLG
ncbi:MAG TPA: hypothetical protein VJO34_03870 [Methylomirabilota bacterium]|nr:hypothetical protein [Methylomirabilota bacterium]